MKFGDIFDEQNKEHRKVFETLPQKMREAIIEQQLELQLEVNRKNGDRFRPSSGWRSDSGNRNSGGKINSKHLWGCALDLISMDGSFDTPPDVCSLRYKVIRSKGCWHVEKR